YEQVGFKLVAADALADAALLAERAGLPIAAELRERSDAIYRAIGAVPVLDLMPAAQGAVALEPAGGG
ncbi:MAG TPA: hypothetical protein VK992_04345, partial [Candidatus Caenarcaniphilales bacterium]|nr:hypothetical protein [Candidatus Caenarcaniphilales bacterium]